MSTRIQPRIYNGTRDFSPAEMSRRETLLEVLRENFRVYGFAPLETPALEYLEILLGKYGDEEQLIYKLDYRNEDPRRRLALRYDLTVPLARYVAQHPDLPLPFKRYQMQPVWRADRPQPRQGRFREFMQCDIDVVGSPSLAADAEVIAACAGLLRRLGLPAFRIGINHRLLLKAMVEAAGIRPELESQVCTAVDKLDKVGLEGVREELAARGISVKEAECILELMARETTTGRPENLEELSTLENGERALRELDELFNLLKPYDLPADTMRTDLYLARGLSYYTGPIFEAVVPDLPHMGSVMGGGRYDGLVGMFLGRDIPATGATLGLDRLVAALDQLEIGATERPPARVLVTRYFEETDEAALRLAAELRRAGLPTELALEREKLKKQYALAHRKGIPWVVTLGPEEWSRGELSLKNMATGEQRVLGHRELLDEIDALHGEGAPHSRPGR